MKAFYSVFVLVLLSVCSFGQANRVIDWTPYTAEPAFVDQSNLRALEIVEFKVDGKVVKPGESFAAEGEWLKTFSVKVRNISGKRISSMSLYFGLPEARYSDGVSGFVLVYGKRPGSVIDNGNYSLIEPNQEIELTRDARYYALERDGIIRRTGISDFHSVIIGVTTLKFEDGALWMAYKLPFASSEIVKKK